ncbi:MAG: hypothetical protein MUP63_00015 [Candidatus Nanohaloarchaeota archaeon QJJ-7]|nr:hypothetical protein [Candidatus Nanohaloarchaeota archaeon QJJ-7]
MLEFTKYDAENAGNIYYQLEGEEVRIGEIDIVIAGVVKRINLTLVTLDHDFEKLSSLDTKFY